MLIAENQIKGIVMALAESIPASTQREYVVTQKDLPLCCPMPDMIIWNAHPRVYLPIAQTGSATCPYCGAHYKLLDRTP